MLFTKTATDVNNLGLILEKPLKETPTSMTPRSYKGVVRSSPQRGNKILGRCKRGGSVVREGEINLPMKLHVKKVGSC